MEDNFYWGCKRYSSNRPGRVRRRYGEPLPRVHPTGLQSGDRIKLDDGRTGTICCAVERNDKVAYAIPDDFGRVATIRILAHSDDLYV